MPRIQRIRHNNLPPFDPDEAQRLRTGGMSYEKIAKQLGSSYGSVYRWLNPHPPATPNGTPPPPERVPPDDAMVSNRSNVMVVDKPSTTLQPIEPVGEVSAEQSSADSADLRAQLAALKAEVDDLKAHRLEVDAWIEALQRQAVQRSAVQSQALQEPAPTHMFLDPDDSKPERWNLWVPRGLKRLTETRTTVSGIAPSQLVQRWLWQVLEGEEGRRDA